jgi:PAS domain S-box-containing protein
MFCTSSCAPDPSLAFEPTMDNMTSRVHVVEQPPTPSPDVKVPSILIVDDHPANLLAFEAVLGPLGHRIVKAASGHEALKQLRTGHFALILLDVQMPGLDGFETAALIQARSKTGRIPIILITAANQDVGQVVKGYSHGAVDYLLKPVDPDILRSKVAVFVELFQKGELIKAQEALLRERERERLEREGARSLAESEERYRSLVLATAHIVWTADRRGRIAVASPSWMVFTGQSVEEHQGLGWLQAVHPDDRDEATRRWLHSVENHEPYDIEYRLRRQGGAYAFMSVRAVPVFDRDGSVREWIGASADITDRKTAEQEREQLYARERQAREAAQEAVHVRDDFLSVASHELNTPLTPLKLQLGMLRRDNDPARLASRLDTIERQVDRFGELVARLLDVSRIAAGRLALEPEALNLKAVMRDVATRFAPEAAAHGCELRFRAQDGVIGWFDRVRMDQVLANLVSNAVKYGQGNPIEMSLDASEGVAHIRVRDQGIGIEPHLQVRIFERFERAVSARHYGGFGLGLWIVRQIVEASGGRIAVESKPGEGSTFSVDLPLPGAAP